MSRLRKWVLGLILVGVLALPGRAQSPFPVEKNSADLDYPRAITFHLQSRYATELQSAELVYGASGRSCAESAGRQSLEVPAARPLTLEWTWDLRRSNNLPPGVRVWWQWQVVDGSGAQLETEVQSLVVEDPNHKWQVLNQGKIWVYWVKGDAAFGKYLLNQAVNSVERLSQKAGVQPNGEIRLTIYPDSESFLEAALGLPGWAGGVAFSEYGSILIAIPAGATTWASHVIPHEIAHLVTDERTFNCLGVRPPTWLHEGLSMVAEGLTPRRDVQFLETAYREDRGLLLHDLANGFSGDSDQVRLAYIQSGMVVEYLVDTHGPEKMAALLAALQSGERIDRALQSVYGFDTDGLEQAWQISAGLVKAGAAAGSTPLPPTASATPVPTLVPWTAVAVSPTATPTLVETPTPPTQVELRAENGVATSTPAVTATPLPVMTEPPASGFPNLALILAGGGLCLTSLLTILVLVFAWSRRRTTAAPRGDA